MCRSPIYVSLGFPTKMLNDFDHSINPPPPVQPSIAVDGAMMENEDDLTYKLGALHNYRLNFIITFV